MHSKLRQRVPGVALAALLLLLSSCGAPPPKTAVKVGPPPMPKIIPYAEPLLAAIPAELPQVNFNDPVDLAIIQAQLQFEKGENLYQSGFLKRSKDEFNGAIDLILETAGVYPKEPRLQHELLALVSRVNAME